ncbi:MAG: hypothetical protein MSA83_09595, partial [Bacteroidales bacterium]|nr:hypothetical protein [Bacteroidales bacterium]
RFSFLQEGFDSTMRYQALDRNIQRFSAMCVYHQKSSHRFNGSVDKYWGHRNKNINNSLLAMPVLRTCR